MNWFWLQFLCTLVTSIGLWNSQFTTKVPVCQRCNDTQNRLWPLGQKYRMFQLLLGQKYHRHKLLHTVYERKNIHDTSLFLQWTNNFVAILNYLVTDGYENICDDCTCTLTWWSLWWHHFTYDLDDILLASRSDACGLWQ